MRLAGKVLYPQVCTTSIRPDRVLLQEYIVNRVERLLIMVRLSIVVQ